MLKSVSSQRGFNQRRFNQRRINQRGFNLIELMIAIVLGLIVSTAVIAFIAAAIRSNGQTVNSTRLNQELRALTELIVRDIRRARSMQDPIANIGCEPDGANACQSLEFLDSLEIPEAGCIRYGYQGAVAADYRVVRRTVTAGRGAIVIARGAAGIDCTAAGTQVSSQIVDITDFTVTAIGNSQIDLELEGRLAGDASIASRRYQTSVHIRSGGI